MQSLFRKFKSKWGIPLDVYPGDVYPVFCHGGMIIWPFSILTRIADISDVTNCTGMHLEDVLISGVLRHKIFNHTDNIIPRGYHGLRGRYIRRGNFVYHLGLSKNLKRSFYIRWLELQSVLRMGRNDRMRNKREFSAYHYNATLMHVEPIKGLNLNQTLNYFVSSWQRFIKNRKSFQDSQARNPGRTSNNSNHVTFAPD